MNPDDIQTHFSVTEDEVDRLWAILAWVDVQWRTKQTAYPDDSPGGGSLQDRLSDPTFRRLLESALADEQWALALPDLTSDDSAEDF